VNILNTLFSQFDAIVFAHDAYKVDALVSTLAMQIRWKQSAYLIVSGIPKENDKRHAGELASVALAMMEVGARTGHTEHGPSPLGA
jgi:hypothetical protein